MLGDVQALQRQRERQRQRKRACDGGGAGLAGGAGLVLSYRFSDTMPHRRSRGFADVCQQRQAVPSKFVLLSRRE